MNQVLTWSERALGAAARTEKSQVVDESDLVARARAGDPVAFERLYEQYHAPILNYLHRMVGDRTLAEDLAQDAFEKAYRGLSSTRPDLAFPPTARGKPSPRIATWPWAAGTDRT